VLWIVVRQRGGKQWRDLLVRNISVELQRAFRFLLSVVLVLLGVQEHRFHSEEGTKSVVPFNIIGATLPVDGMSPPRD
jgi:hypothetical protein